MLQRSGPVAEVSRHIELVVGRVETGPSMAS